MRRFALFVLPALLMASPAMAQVRRPPPAVERISPTSGPPGATVTLHGRYFDEGQTVRLGQVDCPVTARSTSRLTIQIGDGAQSGNLTVHSARGDVRGPRFRVTAARPAPTIAAVVPASAPVGAEVTLQGANFSARTSENTVRLGERALVVRRSTPTELTVRVPDGATSGTFRVRVLGAGEAESPPFTLDEGMQITSMEPAFGPPGTRVVLGGTGFDRRRSRVSVYLGDARARVVRASETELTVELPRRGVETDRFRVVVRGEGETRSSTPFTIRYAPTITSMSPAFGAPGARVTLEGAHFGSDIRQIEATIGGTAMRARDLADGRLMLEVPAGAQSGPIALTVAGMGPTESEPFEVTTRLRVTGFSPQSGPVGSEVTIQGEGFSAELARNTVTLDGQAAEVLRVSPTELVARVPEGRSGPLLVRVENAGDGRTDHPFVLTTPPVVESFSPETGAVGSEVVIRGARFGTRAGLVRVRFGDRLADVRGVTDNTITVVVPDGATTGPLRVTVRLQGTVTTPTPFTVQP
ncbi:MAG: IPT/TIG domain-containing protein [Sandaracinaceae bacterium]